MGAGDGGTGEGGLSEGKKINLFYWELKTQVFCQTDEKTYIWRES